MQSIDFDDRKSFPKLAFVASLLSILAIIMIIIMTVVIKKNWAHNWQVQDQQTDQIQQMQQSMTNVEDMVQRQQLQLNANNDALMHLTQLTSGGENQWVLSEAEYLAQMAQLDLRFQNNINGAIVLLQAADQRLGAVSSPNLLPVRQSIANSIVALQAVPAVDSVGILTRLSALMDQVQQLPLVPQFQAPAPTVKQPKTNTKLDRYLTDWHNALANSSHVLAQLVIIRHHNEPIEPLLPPDQYAYLKQNIELQLQQAQWAVLHRQQIIYNTSLKNIMRWLTRYFTDNGVPSHSVIQAVADLQKINIAPAVPDLSNTIMVIQQAAKPGPAPKISRLEHK